MTRMVVWSYCMLVVVLFVLASAITGVDKATSAPPAKHDRCFTR